VGRNGANFWLPLAERIGAEGRGEGGGEGRGDGRGRRRSKAVKAAAPPEARPGRQMDTGAEARRRTAKAKADSMEDPGPRPRRRLTAAPPVSSAGASICSSTSRPRRRSPRLEGQPNAGVAVIFCLRRPSTC
jgi:hypothetical protein